MPLPIPNDEASCTGSRLYRQVDNFWIGRDPGVFCDSVSDIPQSGAVQSAMSNLVRIAAYFAHRCADISAIARYEHGPPLLWPLMIGGPRGRPAL